MPAKKPTRENLSLYFFIALLTLFSACGLLSSDDKEPLEPGPRNYEWTVDSVYSAPGGWMNTIWGASPDNVWIGSGGGAEKLWHYDGEEWSPYPDRFVGDFHSIYGFAQDDVWMGGGDGEIFHYDGESWELFYKFEKQGYNISRVKDIWGSSSSDLYAIGNALENGEPPYTGFILHYNGETWGELLLTNFGIQFQRIRKDKKGIYIYGSGPYSTQTISDSISFYKVNNNKLRELYSKSRSEAGSPSINKIGDEIYFVLENKITNTNFNSMLPFAIHENIYDVNGRHVKDLFITTENGIMHYNGENTEYLLELESENAVVFRTLIMEKDIFFLVNDYEAGTNLIYHGTLTENEEEGE